MSDRVMEKRALCFFAGITLMLTSCVGNRPYRLGEHYPGLDYRDQQSDLECKAEASTPSLCAGHAQKGAAYDLAYVEFDDMGELWTIGSLKYDRGKPKSTQVDHAIDLIQQRKQENKRVSVITFIHGWKNNASPYDERHDKSLKGFKAWMQELADESPQRSYVGVFVAWRGQSIRGDPFLSYWDRKDAAMRVGRASMTEALFRLMLATKDVVVPNEANRCGTNLPENGDRFVVVGHSFGGRVLARALSQPLLALLLESHAEADACRQEWNRKPEHQSDQLGILQFQSQADLVVLLNTANDSFETKSVIEGMKRMNLRAMTAEDAKSSSGPFFDAPPLIVSILSDGDMATTKLMPFAQAISMPTNSYGRHYDKDGAAEGQVTLSEKKIKQSYFYYRNDGKVSPFLTHNVQEIQLGAATPSPNPPENVDGFGRKLHSDPDCPGLPLYGHSFCFKLPGSPGQPSFHYYAATAHEPSNPQAFRNDTPYWVIRVPSSIIPNHSDVFQLGTNALLKKILKIRTEAASSLSEKASAGDHPGAP